MKLEFPDNGFRRLWRDFSIVSGEPEYCYQQTALRLQGKKPLWVGEQAPQPFAPLPANELLQRLGQDVEHLVFDALQDFDANAFAIAAGLVKGGGTFILMTPALHVWGAGQNQRFARRLAGICLEYQQADISPKASVSGTGLLAATEGQQQLIEAVARVANGHAKRPLVITADRGRGKSAGMGMAAAKLLNEGVQRILVTAPRLIAVEALFRHAAQVLPEAQLQRGCLSYQGCKLQFMAPDAIIQKQPQADILLVDEAAAIPLPLLEKLLRRYKRMVFASTVHGYEGSGKSFSLRFSRLLDRCRPQWKSLKLYEPVRWAEHDPLEDFTFEALLLDAEPAEVSPKTLAEDLKVTCLKREVLLQDEQLLRQLFGLLINAHYRTTPTDLRHLLDASNLTLWVAWLQEKPVAAMLVAMEGNISPALHRQIRVGKRRPRNQLLPVAVATQCVGTSALALKCERIVRIAVHPQLQHQGIGSRMLRVLRDSASDRQVDYLGSSFGATQELVEFWHKNGFSAVRLGYRKEASSGAHSVLMLQGISDAGKELQAQSRQLFVSQFPWQLKEMFSGLNPALAVNLMKDSAAEKEPEFCAAELDLLEAFASGGRQYLDCLAVLQRLALYQLSNPGENAQIFVMKLAQGRSWSELADSLQLSGTKAAQQQLRLAVRAFLDN